MVAALSCLLSDYSSRSSSWRICRCPGQIRTFISICSQDLHPFGHIPNSQLEELWSKPDSEHLIKNKRKSCTCSDIHINSAFGGLLGKMPRLNHLPRCLDLERNKHQFSRKTDKDVFGPDVWQLRLITRLREMPFKRRDR